MKELITLFLNKEATAKANKMIDERIAYYEKQEENKRKTRAKKIVKQSKTMGELEL
jgi:hypothetical protein